jgi:hypothetical protein
VSIHNPTYPPKADLLAASQKPIAAWIKTAALAMIVVGVIAFAAGVAMSPDRIWRAFHFNWLYFSAISSGGVMFVAIFRIVTARWSRSIARLMEGYVAFLPVSWLFLVLSLTIGGKHIFPWIADPNALPNSERIFWLGNHTFFALREIGVLTVLYALQIWFIYNSLRIDVAQLPEWGSKWAAGLRAKMRTGWGEERRELHNQHSLQGKIAVTMAIIFGFGWMMLHYDLSMSLDVYFYSTLWGWWSFMAGIMGFLMSFAMIMLIWRKHFNSPVINSIIGDQQIHDLGKLCFAWTAFWGYTTFAQLLIIWYGNIGEETHFFRLRLISPWLPVSFSVLMLTFVAPFPGLISKAAKMFLPTYIIFACASLIGTYLQRYIEVYPSLFGVPADGVPFGWQELGVTAMYLGIWITCYTQFFAAFPRLRLSWMTSKYRDEMQIPVDIRTMEPLPAHE